MDVNFNTSNKMRKVLKLNEINVPRVGVGVIVEKGGKILLGKRKGSHCESTWCPPGGHLEFGEKVEDCAKRELLEETGLAATKFTLSIWAEDIMEEGQKHYISLYVIVTEFTGELQLLEPNKCEEWRWFSYKDLPEPLFPPLVSFIKKRACCEQTH